MRIFSYDFEALDKKSFYTIFLPLIFISLTFLILTLFYMKASHFKEHKADFSTHVASQMKNIQTTLDYEAMYLTALLDSIQMNPNLAHMLQTGDKQALLRSFASLYKTMNSTSKITHLYFLNADLHTVLRAHNPKKDGDIIDRYTAHQAQWREQLFYGLEIGVHGNTTLRVVLPIKENGKIAGYVEIGKEFENLLFSMREYYTHDTILLLHKSFLDKENFLATMHKQGREVRWDIDKNYVLTYATIPLFNQTYPSLLNAKDHINSFIFNDKHYLSTSEILLDASGKEIGRLLFVKEISSLLENDDLLFNSISLFATVAFVIFLALIYVILQHSQKSINQQTAELSKSQQRIKALEKLSRTITWEVDKNGLYTYVSDSIFSILGYFPQDIVFDIDFFKKINDTQGHLVGDEILKSLASLVKEEIRKSDMFARWGGEEFILLLPNTKLQSAYEVALSLREKIENFIFTKGIKITCSFGVAGMRQKETSYELLMRVDSLLYEAKEAGRNTVIQ